MIRFNVVESEFSCHVSVITKISMHSLTIVREIVAALFPTDWAFTHAIDRSLVAEKLQAYGGINIKICVLLFSIRRRKVENCHRPIAYGI